MDIMQLSEQKDCPLISRPYPPEQQSPMLQDLGARLTRKRTRTSFNHDDERPSFHDNHQLPDDDQKDGQ